MRQGGHDNEWVVRFTEGFPMEELKRGFPSLLFTETEVLPWDYQVLCALLRRAAEIGVSVPDAPLAAFRKELDTAMATQGILEGTEAERLVKQRIGQGHYRNALLSYWEGACSLTGVDIPELLRASHAKPWAECASDSERLDVYNGFLLSANIDALFDTGLISFTDDGSILISHQIHQNKYALIGLHSGMILRWLDSRHLVYLRWHREHLFARNRGSGERT
ncbi:MAG TPA: HNH endonuclease [Rectinemataceae bacterium]|nr:HNH endonuclease [Rectinemataceae bacterium]